MSSPTRSLRNRFQTRFVVLLIVALALTIGLVQKRGTFVRPAQASPNAAFTPGNIVVVRFGDGAAALSAVATAAFLDEYTPAGALVQSIPLPTTVNGANKRLTVAGNSTSEGFITRSVDGNYLVVAGYDAALATAAVAGTTSATVNRVIARIDAGGNIDTTTALTDAISAGNPRGATTTNGSDLWISGTSAGGGMRYTTLGATTSTALTAGITNLRATNIFGGQLYVSSASGAARFFAIGTGTPTTAGQPQNTVPGLDNTTLVGPYAFFFADLSGGVAGVDTAYFADEGGNAIKKFSLVGGTWVPNGTIVSTAVRGITGSASGTNVTLFAQSNGATLGTLTDTSGYNATITGTLVTIATAGVNTAFRGVTLVPAPATPTLNVGDVTQNETDAGTTTFTFNVNLTSPAPAGGVTFDIATADGSAQDGVPGGDDNDYVAKSETGRTITAGNTSATFTVTVNGDTTPETNETFFANVTNVVGANAGDLQGLGTITNDDNVTPTLNINDVTQAETNAGTTTFTFNVSLTSAALAGGVTFDIATADGTAQDDTPATEDNDYVANSLTSQTITAGNTTYNFNVTVNGDGVTEPNETFFVNVSNIVGATAGDTQGLGTITNDDVTITPIHTIQGNGSTSPLVSTVVTTSGIVTGVKSNGFFIQEPDASVDADPNTSEGIFVFTSSVPPASAAIGNMVSVTGTVQEFIPSQDLDSPPTTELITPTTNLLTTGNPLPAAILITAAETTQASETSDPLDSLEEFEGMRVTVASLTVGGPSQGTITEPSATVASTGVFLGVVTGVARPFREPGIAISDPLPGGAPVTIPRFDENPERIRVDSDALTGTTAIDVTAGTIVTNITGPLDYAFRCYTIDPDLATPPNVGVQPGSVPAPAATANEVTVASFNMERFFDTVDAAGTSDAVLTPAAYNRRVAKASLIIRTVQRYPDVIGVQEMENLTTLQAVAAQVNTDAVSLDALPNPNYVAYLVEGNDIGGIDVGFLVKQSRLTTVDVTQIELAGCDHVTATTCNNYINPNNGLPEILNDRPPLVLRVTVPRPGGGTLPLTIIDNHMRSLSSVDDATDGNRVRTKRRAGAEFLANYIQSRQVGNPTELIITLGDLNAFNVNDGYVDVIGTIKGTPAPASQVTLASPDLVNPDLTDLIDILPAAQQYSYNFDGNAQVLDHIIVNHKAGVFLTRFAYARNDSDFAVKNYELTNEKRISDHDQPIAYFSLTLDPTASNGVVSGRITEPNGNPIAGAVVSLSGTQSRKFITDANGNYRFEGVETNGFYTVRPERANYSFTPAERSFSQVSNNTEAVFTGTVAGDAGNPLDTPEYFVRQHYLDFLGREPDEAGFNFWSDQILECGSDSACIERRTINVSAAYFLSIEFQQTGGLVDGLYRASYDRAPRYAEFLPDSGAIAAGVIVGRPGWAQQLAANKAAFVDGWMARPEFRAAYDGLGNAAYVDALIAHAGGFNGDRNVLVSGLDASTLNRAGALRQIVENDGFLEAKRNASFVMMEYFGYLRRDPDASGYQFWLNKLNQFDGNFEQAEMVKAFIVSGEYRARPVR